MPGSFDVMDISSGFAGKVNVQKKYLASIRTYGTGSTARAGFRKSKEKRFELVVEFVAKYQASHSGKFPGISIVRKEVGGKYETLKEILHRLENTKQGGNVEGSSAAILSGPEKQPITERAEKKGLKSCTTVKDAECMTDRITTKAAEPPVQLLGFGLNLSQPGKVENYGGVAASKDPVQVSQQMTLLEITPGDSHLVAEFPLCLHGIPGCTTSKDLREAFQDCGEIWNATTLNSVGRVCSDAVVNFKTVEGLRAARMKETVQIRGQVVNVNSKNKSTACQVKQAKAPS
ncbi:hypothetical protein L7F22_038386 [Adiantum nelumboides]|nr:hypothetical protein [Adiantum nelumboides]